MKLNVLLAMTDALRVKYKDMVSNYSKFFSKNGGAFLGERNTYLPREGTVDDISKRSYTAVITTVDEKLDYFISEAKEFIDALFSQEKTNSSGEAVAELVVDGNSWGIFTSLELLRLKSLLEASDLGNLETMLSEVPVRSDAQIWTKTSQDEYRGRKVFEGPISQGVSKTTVKEEYILEDPNLKSGKTDTYTPQKSVRNISMELGDYTSQKFSGEWSQRQKTGALKRRNDLLVAVIKALKESNECESLKSDLTAEKIFGFIFGKQ